MKNLQLVPKESNCFTKNPQNSIFKPPPLFGPEIEWCQGSHTKSDILVPEKHGQPIKIKRGNQDFSLEARKRGKLFRVPDRQRALEAGDCLKHNSSLLQLLSSSGRFLQRTEPNLVTDEES